MKNENLDLNLPVFSGKLLEPEPLSMDRYYEFVMFNWKYTVDREAAWEWKKKIAVDVPFKL